MQQAFSVESEYSDEVVNHLDVIGSIDHTDLQWSTEIDLSHLNHNLKLKVQNFLNNNKDVFASSVLDLPGCSTVLHTLKVADDTPVRSSAYRVPYNLREEMDRQLNLLIEANILLPSNSHYASPVILVKKADGGYRLACDFRKLNKKLVGDAYPIPNITETIDSLAGAKVFSTLDLTSGFFQQMIPEEQQHLTSIITHRGSFMWSRSPFGLLSSGSCFQRLMNYVLGDLREFNILIYLDDICVASKDVESHFQKLELVFQRLRQHNLKLKPSKCKFFKSEINFLGFQIADGKVSPATKNVETVKNFKTPNSRKQVRSFLGCINFYRRNFPNLASRSVHLTNLTKEQNKFCWTPEADQEFQDLKQELLRFPSLNLPDMGKEFVLYTDSSQTALGAVLAQFDNNNFPCPVAFASRKLKDVETRYSTTERELLAVVWAINYFKCYLYNNKFTVYTDHASLTSALKLSNPPSRIGRWLTAIADYDFDIKYIKGKCNTIADFLSRFVEYETETVMQIVNYADVVGNENRISGGNINSNLENNNSVEVTNNIGNRLQSNVNNYEESNANYVRSSNEIDIFDMQQEIQCNNNNGVNNVMYEQINVLDSIVIGDSESLMVEIRDAQNQDKFCVNIVNRLIKNLNISPKSYQFLVENEILKCRMLKPKSRRDQNLKIVLPRCLVPRIFNLSHNSAAACHAGFFKTMQRIQSNYFWPGMYSDVKKLIKSCSSCLEFKAHKPKVLAEMQKLEVASSPGQIWHFDISGPFNLTFQGNKYIVAFVDSFSKWPEAFAVPNITSDTIAGILSKVISRHGCPKILISDRGSNLISKAITNVYQKLGIKHITTTAYRPSSNGKIERQNASLNAALAQLVNSSHDNWDEQLDFALLALRSSVHTSINETPFFVTYGRDIRLPYNILASDHPLNYNDSPSYCEYLIPTLSNTYKNVKAKLEAVAEKQVETRSKVAKDKHIKINDLVMLFTPAVKPGLCKKFAKLNTGPFRVIEKTTPVNYKIQCLKNPSNVQNVHVERITKITQKPIFPAWPDEVSDENSLETAVENNPLAQDHLFDPLSNYMSKRRHRRGQFRILTDFVSKTNISSNEVIKVNNNNGQINTNNDVGDLDIRNSENTRISNEASNLVCNKMCIDNVNINNSSVKGTCNVATNNVIPNYEIQNSVCSVPPSPNSGFANTHLESSQIENVENFDNGELSVNNVFSNSVNMSNTMVTGDNLGDSVASTSSHCKNVNKTVKQHRSKSCSRSGESLRAQKQPGMSKNIRRQKRVEYVANTPHKYNLRNRQNRSYNYSDEDSL